MATELKYTEMDGTGFSNGICMSKIRLNGPYVNKKGYLWHPVPQSVLGGFTTKFQIQVLERSVSCRQIKNSQADTYFYTQCDSRGADGLAFVIRGSTSKKIGSGGKELGYGGIRNSIAVEFDTWWNEDYEEKLGGAGHISINTRGHLTNNASHRFSVASLPYEKVRNSLVKDVIVKYTPGSFSLDSVNEDVVDADRYLSSTAGHLLGSRSLWPFLASKNVGLLEVFVDNLEVPFISIPIDLSKVIDSQDGRAIVGFTSSTDEYFEAHDLLQWYFCEGGDCKGKPWIDSTAESSCEEVACPRGYPWMFYKGKVKTTVIGATT